MSVLGRSPLAGWLAWVAALLTPVAGVPHLVCQCPDGHVKEFCLSTARSSSGCCCGRACCARSPGGPCCCRGKHGKTAAGQDRCGAGDARHQAGSGDNLLVEPACCVRSPAGPAPLAIAPHQKAPADDRNFAALLPPGVGSVYALTPGAPGRPAGLAHSLAPPPDLVTLLGRLLI
jgi:hypothetical protein